jgi:hypothetical protein
MSMSEITAKTHEQRDIRAGGEAGRQNKGIE